MIDVYMAYCEKKPFVSIYYSFQWDSVLAKYWLQRSKVKTLTVSAEYRSAIGFPEFQYFYYNDLGKCLRRVTLPNFAVLNSTYRELKNRYELRTCVCYLENKDHVEKKATHASRTKDICALSL